MLSMLIIVVIQGRMTFSHSYLLKLYYFAYNTNPFNHLPINLIFYIMTTRRLILLLVLAVCAISADPYKSKLASRLTHFSAIAY
jgi:hypothetical protein